MIVDSLAGLALAPVLYLQGRRARRTTPLLPEPPGPREGEVGAGREMRLLITGDSAAAGVGAPDQERALAGRLLAELSPDFRVTWRLVARTGATTRGTRRHLAALEAERWDVVLVSLGVNDVTSGVRLGRWLEDQREFVGLLRERYRPRLIVLSGLPPMHRFSALPQPLRWYLGRRARRFDAALARWAGHESDLRHLDADVADGDDLIASDGFHPSPAGYARWAHAAARCLQESY